MPNGHSTRRPTRSSSDGLSRVGDAHVHCLVGRLHRKIHELQGSAARATINPTGNATAELTVGPSRQSMPSASTKTNASQGLVEQPSKGSAVVSAAPVSGFVAVNEKNTVDTEQRRTSNGTSLSDERMQQRASTADDAQLSLFVRRFQLRQCSRN
jgi:hypothetical protein